MATPAQITANQANAQASTGPKTAEGKASSSRNAAKHGLSSAFTVLAHEDQDEFDVLLACFREEHRPANAHQSFLVDQLAVSQWQLARAQRLQNMAFDYLAGAQSGAAADPDARIIAEMFRTNPNAITTLDRYAAHAERSYHKTYKELKLANQIQTEADIVGRLDSGSIQRVTQAPTPKHPACPSHSVRNEPNPAKPSLRSQYPENLALCL